MGAVSKIFKVIDGAKVGVDMEDAFEAYRETKDVLMFGDCPDNVVVDPLDMFGTLNVKSFFESMLYEGDMLFASIQEKSERVDGVLSRDQERGRVDKLVKDINDLGEEIFKTPLITRHDEECSHYNLEELGKMLHSLVGRVILSSISEVPDVLVKYSKKWAENLDEEKIERGIEIAGKVSALLEKLVEGDRNSIHPEMASHENGARASESGDIEAAAGPTE